VNKENRGVLVGMVLGDGYIRVASKRDQEMDRRTSPQISFSHCMDQYEYAKYKVDKLNKIFGGKATLRTGMYNTTYQDNYIKCYANKSNPYFKSLKRMMYRNGKKYITKRVLDMLTPEGIAFWFMDDGSYRINKNKDGRISSVSLTISTYCSREEVDNIIDFFLNVYDIIFKPAYCKKTKLWYVRTNTNEAIKLSNLISPYIIDSMQYKLRAVKYVQKDKSAQYPIIFG
jgi:hypothetical protein